MMKTGIDTGLEANKAIVRRYKVEILNSREWDALDEVAADDYLDHAAFAGQRPGLDGLKQRVASICEALDPTWTIDDIVAERDMVVLRWHNTGSHKGAFLGVGATGRAFTFRGIDIYRIREGKMAEHWNVVDAYGFLRQVGAIT